MPACPARARGRRGRDRALPPGPARACGRRAAAGRRRRTRGGSERRSVQASRSASSAEASRQIERRLALAREDGGVVALHRPEVGQVEDVVGSAHDQGVEPLLFHERAHPFELQARHGASSRHRHAIGAPPSRRHVRVSRVPSTVEGGGCRKPHPGWGHGVSRASGTVTSGRAGGRFAVGLLPRDDRVAQHADPLDLSLHHVARLEVERGRVVAEAGHAADRARSRPRRPPSSRAPSSG